jgi:hypothetical protein
LIHIDARHSRQDRDPWIVRHITDLDTGVNNSRNFESRFRIDVLDLPAYPIFMTSIEAAPILDEQTCWQAVLERDRRSDGKFVYAVRSTGIFCRPSCPSRKPRREQVSFFPDPGAAQHRGTAHASDAALRKNRAKTLIPSWWVRHVSIWRLTTRTPSAWNR